MTPEEIKACLERSDLLSRRRVAQANEGSEIKRMRIKAERGDPESMHGLFSSLCFRNGTKVTTDPHFCQYDVTDGVDWLRKLANSSEHLDNHQNKYFIFRANSMMGYLTHKGLLDVPKALHTAEEWYRRAIEIRNCYCIEEEIENHVLVARYPVLDPDCYSGAEWNYSSQPHLSAPLNLRIAIGDLLLEMNPQERVMEAMEWYEKSAKDESTGAMNRMAGLYLAGTFIPKDEQLALQLLCKSCERGDQKARSMLENRNIDNLLADHPIRKHLPRYQQQTP